jgi:transcriptional regulator with XRE-family HTH domain
LIPPLSPDEYKQLEDNCVAEGIRDPLVVWELDEPDGIFDSILIDGHNRFEISTKHGGILFNVVRKKFSSRNEVMAWIIQNQFGRRNLSAYDRSVLALKLKPLIQEKAKEKETERKTTYQKSEKSNMPTVNTTKELAKAAGVSHDTIHKVEKIEAEASEKTKQAIRNGDISINHAFNNLPSQRNKDIVKEAKRQAQKEHLEYLEEKAS